jgi:predicted esterase
MQEHHISVSRTARYYTLGTLNDNTKNVWFVLHGYGQLAQYFIRKFKGMANDDMFIVAPEALSRFYLKEFDGRVGATWMTREDRLVEIDDYINYLNDLYDSVLGGRKDLKINILGFSQGTITALRWVNDGHVHCDAISLWAGFFSKGIADILPPANLADIDTTFVYGTQDEFLVNIDIEKYEADIKTNIPHARIVTFNGLHTVDETTLLGLYK